MRRGKRWTVRSHRRLQLTVTTLLRKATRPAFLNSIFTYILKFYFHPFTILHLAFSIQHSTFNIQHFMHLAMCSRQRLAQSRKMHRYQCQHHCAKTRRHSSHLSESPSCHSTMQPISISQPLVAPVRISTHFSTPCAVFKLYLLYKHPIIYSLYYITPPKYATPAAVFMYSTPKL